MLSSVCLESCLTAVAKAEDGNKRCCSLENL
jgi:hypothetical protein